MIYSLGHSTFTQIDFTDICKTSLIDIIIDTRSHLGSAKYPHFNKNQMAEWLPTAGIGYEWWPELGGWNNQHAELAPNFIDHDVDVSAYCNNHFPKQRIAKKRELNGRA